jgi:hypothetical protein
MKDTQKAQSVEEAAISIIKKEKGQPFPSEIECFKLGAQWQQSQPGTNQCVSEDQIEKLWRGNCEEFEGSIIMSKSSFIIAINKLKELK